jgi:DNA-binding transcriptional ArsR family regulator
MRNSNLLGALISRTKQQILAATILQPDHAWYLLELARHLRVRPSTLQRELKVLGEAGILKRHKNGNRAYFEADTSCPIFRELAQILFKTVGVADVLRKALQPVASRIDVAWIYGSMADASERSHSDIDLLVVGSVSLSEMAVILRKEEGQLGRAINPTVYQPEEFMRRCKEKNHFITGVLAKEPLFILGGPHELGKLTPKRPS